MEYVLETNNITKSYKKQKVLCGINIHVKKGSIYGLVGKNGAGKTTIIRIVCGLQNADNGTYKIYNIQNNDKNIYEARKRMGAIVETPSFYPSLNAYDNLKMFCDLTGIVSCDDILPTLKLVGLKNDKKKVKNYSLGMKQRLGIAMALITNPDFLILDEPINGLDPVGIIEIRELILKLNKERNITILISSHYLDELSKIATDYGFVNNGIITKEISSEELMESLKNRVIIKTKNINEAIKYLEKNRYDYEVQKESIIIYECKNLSNLLLNIAKVCDIESIQEKDENLETYYMNLIGGGTNE